MLVDTHAHLDFPEFIHDIPGVLSRAREANVTKVITIGIDLQSSRQAIQLAREYEPIHATVGIHPHEAGQLSRDDLDLMRRLAVEKPVVAIGEIGLDFFRDRRPRSIQLSCMRRQIELAIQLNLPAVFHVRDAHQEFLGVIREYPAIWGNAVLHCFSGSWDIARKCLDLGFYLSIPGTVTFSKAETQQQVARNTPLERLLVETDAPYLAPVPHRGKVNEPAYLPYTARKIAELRGVLFDTIAQETSTNAKRIFNL
ncbi:MAG: TatD family hydrolase [Syntrophobacteraceae bacterium]|nr:TatD family hydrolase [Syntrophobacteraceae bacterium]